MSRSRNSRRGTYPRDVVMVGDIKIDDDGKVRGYKECNGLNQKRHAKKAASRARRKIRIDYDDVDR